MSRMADAEIAFRGYAVDIVRDVTDGGRIVFNFAEGDRVKRGQRVGLIKFGSRVDVVVPAEAVLEVKVGDKVKGGSSVLAAMQAGADA